MAKAIDFNKHIWEGWTIQNFIDELQITLDDIMNGLTWMKPFTTKKEIADWCKSHQPYYKKAIPEVNRYFCERYGIK